MKIFLPKEYNNKPVPYLFNQASVGIFRMISYQDTAKAINDEHSKELTAVYELYKKMAKKVSSDEPLPKVWITRATNTKYVDIVLAVANDMNIVHNDWLSAHNDVQDILRAAKNS